MQNTLVLWAIVQNQHISHMKIGHFNSKHTKGWYPKCSTYFSAKTYDRFPQTIADCSIDVAIKVFGTNQNENSTYSDILQLQFYKLNLLYKINWVN